MRAAQSGADHRDVRRLHRPLPDRPQNFKRRFGVFPRRLRPHMSQAEDFSGDLPETSRNPHAMCADSLTERVVRPSFGKINRGHGGRRYRVRLREEPVPGLDEARTNECRDGFMPHENGFKSLAIQNTVQYIVQRRGLVPIFLITSTFSGASSPPFALKLTCTLSSCHTA